MNHRHVWQATFAFVGGFLLGTAFALLTPGPDSHLAWAAAYVLLGALAASVIIPLTPHGSLNLAPIVFMVVALALNPWEGIIVAAISPVIAAAAGLLFSTPKRPSAEILAQAGETTLSLSVAAAAAGLVPRTAQVFVLPIICLSTLLVLEMARVSIFEEVRIVRLFGPMMRSSFPHIVASAIAVPLVWAIYRLIGPIGIVLPSIVIVEMYYPWKLLGEQRDLFLKSLEMMSNAVDLKDPYTAHHSRRVSAYAMKMARALGVPEEEVERIRIGALMHDIGKIGVPGSVIRKPSKLTDDEMAIMKSHVRSGAGIVENLEILNRSTDIVRHHHENYDGTGYPSGLAGHAIPLGARIVFVADAFDALTTDRPYRKGKSIRDAVKVLEANVSTQFDPNAVEALKVILRVPS